MQRRERRRAGEMAKRRNGDGAKQQWPLFGGARLPNVHLVSQGWEFVRIDREQGRRAVPSRWSRDVARPELVG